MPGWKAAVATVGVFLLSTALHAHEPDRRMAGSADTNGAPSPRPINPRALDPIVGTWGGTLAGGATDSQLDLYLGQLGPNPFDPINPRSRRSLGYISVSEPAKPERSQSSMVAYFTNQGGGKYSVYVAGHTRSPDQTSVPIELFGSVSLGGPSPSDDAAQGTWRTPLAGGAWNLEHLNAVRVKPPVLTERDLRGTWLVSLAPEGEPSFEAFCAEIRQFNASRAASQWWPQESQYMQPLSGVILGDRLDVWGTGQNYGNPTVFRATCTTDGNTMSGSFTASGADAGTGTWTATRAACKSSRGTIRVSSFADGRYAVDFWVTALVRGQIPASATVTGPQTGGVLQLNTTEHTVLWLGAAPVAGDLYTFTFSYADGFAEVVTDALRPTYVGFPTILSPTEGQVVNTLTPTVEWAQPSCGCQGYLPSLGPRCVR
jgi:hypothetical protein